ncbi:hypothetical protein AB0G02_21810 [Actinosynnema sp. NPDC023658]|uniref:hypothetical protein n=1 Tax=Actinosynnema sp. NPDC023658 TaxID=3155465 RepID=UPI0034039060
MSRTARCRTAVSLVGAALVLVGACTPPAAAQRGRPAGGRIAVLQGDRLYANEGDVAAQWVFQEEGVGDYDLFGDRIGVFKDCALLVKEGGVGSAWQVVAPDSVTDFQLEDDRIGYLDRGALWVVEGALDAEPVLQERDVRAFQLHGDRIGVLKTDGSLLVKEGDPRSGWRVVDPGPVTAFQLSGDRIAFARDPAAGDARANGSELWVKQGDLSADPVFQERDVRKFQLSGDRVGVLKTDGSLLAKGGVLEPGWFTVDTDSVTDFQLDHDRIAFTEGGSLWAKEGPLDAGLVHQEDGVSAFLLAGDRVAALKGGALLVKAGGLGLGWHTAVPASVTDFRLVPPPRAAGLVTLADLKAIFGYLGDERLIEEGLPRLNEEMVAGRIDNPARIAAFLATLRGESAFRYDAQEVGNPSTYRGRGYIQLTGLANYEAAGQHLGHDVVAAPDDVATIAWSAPVARYYRTVARPSTNDYADALDMGGVSRNIGYANPEREDPRRCADFKEALRHFNGGELPPGTITCNRH